MLSKRISKNDLEISLELKKRERQSLITLIDACSTCAVCEGAAYQTPPQLGITRMNEPILVLMQSPREIRSSDSNRMWWVDHFAKMSPLPEGLMTWYEWDFLMSKAYQELEKILGKDWLYTKQFAYSTSVRCRIPGNAVPSEDMQRACKIYTRQLIYGRSGLILVGDIAVKQIIGDAEFGWGRTLRIKDGPLILPIKHYAAWTEKSIVIYSKAIKKMIEE